MPEDIFFRSCGSVVAARGVTGLLTSAAPVGTVLALLALPVRAGADGTQNAAGDAVGSFAGLSHATLVFGGDGAAVEGVSLLLLLHRLRAFA